MKVIARSCMQFSKPFANMNSPPIRGDLPSNRVTCSGVKVARESLGKLLHTLLFYYAMGKRKKKTETLPFSPTGKSNFISFYGLFLPIGSSKEVTRLVILNKTSFLGTIWLINSNLTSDGWVSGHKLKTIQKWDRAQKWPILTWKDETWLTSDLLRGRRKSYSKQAIEFMPCLKG